MTVKSKTLTTTKNKQLNHTFTKAQMVILLIIVDGQHVRFLHVMLLWFDAQSFENI